MNRYIVTESKKITLNGQPYLLEVGDRILVEEAKTRKYLKVYFPDGNKYYAASGTNMNWLVYAVKKMCNKLQYPYKVEIVRENHGDIYPEHLRRFIDGELLK